MNNWLLRAISVSMMVVSILATSRSTQRSTRKRSYKRGQSPSDAYERYVKRYNTYKRMYYEQFNPEKVKGRCAYSKNWKINGTNPIYEKSRFGYITILYLINTKCRYCVNELKSLHIWAEYFKKINKKVAIVALNQRYTRQSPYVIDQFPLIKIHQEPSQMNIFKKLRGKAGDLHVYDQCGRHLYNFERPYSSLVQPFVRLAIQNTEYHYQSMCGECSRQKSRNTQRTITAPTITPAKRKRVTKILPITENRVIQQAAKFPTIIEVNITKVASTNKPITTQKVTTEVLKITSNTNTQPEFSNIHTTSTRTEQRKNENDKLFKSTRSQIGKTKLYTTPSKPYTKSKTSTLLIKKIKERLSTTMKSRVRFNRNAISTRGSAFNTQSTTTITSSSYALDVVDGAGESTDKSKHIYSTDTLTTLADTLSTAVDTLSTESSLTTDPNFISTTETPFTTLTDAGHLMIWEIDGPFN